MTDVEHLLYDQLQFGEGPRWRNGLLYVADQHAREVVTIAQDGAVQAVLSVPGQPSGLGWLPDGTMLVVSMADRRLCALRNGQLVTHADLSGIAAGHCNDMVVDAQGRAYVGNFGFEFDAGGELAPARLALVHPDGRAEAVADELLFPNGMVITPDGHTLVVAETFGQRLTAFTIAADGSLSERREWAALSVPPDGICLDESGAIWVSCPLPPGGYYRVAEGGQVLEQLESPGDYCGIACMLGGADRRSLFMLEAKTYVPSQTRRGNSRVRVVQVKHAGAGCPAWLP